MKNKFIKFIPAVVFIVFTLSLSVLFFALPKSDYSSQEKRYLANTPTFSLESLFSGKLIKEIDGDSEAGKAGFVADHFPFRSFFVGFNAYYNLSFMNTSDNDYYFGKDGYIISKPYETGRLDTNMKVINKFAENIDTTLVVVPSTGYIMSDKLPLNHVAYQDEEVFAKIRKNVNNAEFFDLSPAFKELKESGTSLYYKTDHHWTTLGAFCAYESLGDVLGYTPLTAEDFKSEQYPGFYGTTYSSSGYFLRDPDTLEILRKENKGLTVEITESGKTEPFDSMYFESHLSEDDMYPVFLDGNHSLVKITNPNAEKNEKLLVLKDSYAHALVPFLAENYREIVMVDMRYYKENITELCKIHGISKALVLYSISNFCSDTSLALLE